MKSEVRNILAGIAAVLLLIAMIVVFIKGNNGSNRATCKGIELTVADSVRNAFINKSDIEKILLTEYGEFKGKDISEIDVNKIESILDSKSSIDKSEVYFTGNGLLHVYISQLIPAIKFMTDQTGFYADADGIIFPLQKVAKAGIPVVEGAVPVNFKEGYKGPAGTDAERIWIKKMLELETYIQKSSIWRRDISGIKVRKGGEIVLVPAEGKEVFIFGQPENIKEKFDKIEKYYTHILPAKGEGTYKSVDVKFDGQIICRK